LNKKGRHSVGLISVLAERFPGGDQSNQLIYMASFSTNVVPNS